MRSNLLAPWLLVTWHDGGVRVEASQLPSQDAAPLAALIRAAVGQSQLQKDSR